MRDNLTQYSTWYVALIAAGAVIAAPAGATGNSPFFLVGIGLVMLGAGEFICHPYRETHFPGGKITGRPRRWSLPGLFMDLIGLSLFAYGIWQIVNR